MKILLVARWPVGGIKTYFRYIYGTEVFQKAEIYLLAPEEGLIDFIGSQLPANRIKLINVDGSAKAIKNELKKLLKEQSFDLIHSHGFSASFYVQQVVWLKKIPHIMTAHDVFLPNTFVGVNGFFKRIAMYWLLCSVTKVLSVSEDARNNIYEYFPSLKSTQIKNITNGIDSDFFAHAQPCNYRQELSLGQRPIIGFFGRFMAQKGFRQLIYAMEVIVNEKRLDLIPQVLTFGWGGFIREDFELIEQKGLSSYFTQLPGTNNMPSAIRGVDLVVMPSRWEACPLLPMEVLCCGIPIVGTNCVGLREVLSDTPAKVVPVGNHVELANAICAQFAEGKIEFMNYQSIALERFSALNHSRTLYEFYESLLGSNEK